ncbi:MAG: hypothetical protein GXP04_02005 [Alphaproteobacteria bacterium]|nr:hypothetical protein [Alphaproteobacteria bacterium]
MTQIEHMDLGMLSLFKKKSNIDEDFFDWAITISKWAIASFDGLEQLQKAPLVTPGISFFPRSELSHHERAVELFDQVKQLADMRDWECELKAHSEQAPHHLGASVMQKYETNRPLGTFSETQTDGRIISTITYEPSLLKRPIDLIATFSHELAHLLMTSATTELPFDEEMHEPATDSIAIMIGFGIFIANGSSGFHTDDQGWGYHRSGYLCEGEILHVLSAFLYLSDNSIDDTKQYLKPHLYKRLQKISAEMSTRKELINLR